MASAAAAVVVQIHDPLLQPPPLLGWRSSEAQKSFLTAAFLEADAQMGMDEGCTASAVIVQAEGDGSWVVQSANVGDSSAVLVDVTRCAECGQSGSRGIWTEEQRFAGNLSHGRCHVTPTDNCLPGDARASFKGFPSEQECLLDLMNRHPYLLMISLQPVACMPSHAAQTASVQSNHRSNDLHPEWCTSII